MGARERTKGAAWEREVAARFREALPGCGARRGLQARSGSDASDVDVPAFWVECKHQRAPRAEAALRQAQEAAGAEGSSKWPIAVIKRNRAAPYVVIGLEDFLELAAAWEAGGEPDSADRADTRRIAARGHHG